MYYLRTAKLCINFIVCPYIGTHLYCLPYTQLITLLILDQKIGLKPEILKFFYFVRI